MSINRINFSLSALDDFNDIIDVRSPLEYAEDHIPGSLNFPVLSDRERELVGTVYKKDNKFEAKKLGAYLVAQNISKHIEEKLIEKGKDWRPLIYCWRGGQRSYSFATILSQIGWEVGIVEGGYKSFRKCVTTFLDNQIKAFKVILIAGNTGTAKTNMLKILESKEVQTIDLEHLANHKGSVFGSQGQKQPSQKHFETNLYNEFRNKKEKHYILLEAESNKIGNISIPRELWAIMKYAPRIELFSTLEHRSHFLVNEYAEITKNSNLLEKQITGLTRLSGSIKVDRWLKLANEKEFLRLAKELMEFHYDPRYKKSQLRHEGNLICSINLDDISTAKLDKVANNIKNVVANFQEN